MILNHGFPPVLADIVFQLNTILTIIVYSAKAVVYFARGEYKPILLGMGYDFFENFFVLCHAAKVAKKNKLTKGEGRVGDGETRGWGDTESGRRGEWEEGGDTGKGRWGRNGDGEKRRYFVKADSLSDSKFVAIGFWGESAI